MSQAELAERMTKLGTPWKRATVVNLEKRGTTSRKRGTAAGRDSVTAQELLRLAVVLDVPPGWLLADPKSEAPVPIANGIELDPWSALLWMTGEQRLPNPPIPLRLDSEWSEPALALRIIRQVANDLANYRLSQVISMDDDVRDTQHRHILVGLRSRLDQLLAREYPLPPVPDDVRQHARELRVPLPPELRAADDAEEHSYVEFSVVPRHDHPRRQQPAQEV